MLKSLLCATLIAASLLTIGCKKDDDDPVNCNQWAVETQDEAQAVSDASIAWGNDPTNNDKCLAYKVALQAYVDVLEDAENCANQVGQHDNWELAIESANLSISSLPC
jgi:hypothetical protein